MKKVLIIGAGLSGLSCAVSLINKYRKNIQITIMSENLGGLCIDNDDICSDYYFQKYGPHFFHTNNKKVWDFVNSFEKFIPYFHKVKTCVYGNFLDFPINKKVLKFFNLENEEFFKYTHLKDVSAKEYLEKNIGKTLTNLFFKGYCEKHWNMSLDEIPCEIVKRIKIRNNYQNNYFNDKYQGLPTTSYRNLFLKMKKFCENNGNFTFMNKCLVNPSYFNNLIKSKEFNVFIITGRPDILLFGKEKLKYIKTFFSIKKDRYYERFFKDDSSVTNFPINFDFTRITSFGKIFRNKNNNYYCIETPNIDSPLVIDTHPVTWDKKSNESLVEIKNYIEFLQDEYNIQIELLGRLGSFRYLNMDEAILQGFKVSEKV